MQDGKIRAIVCYKLDRIGRKTTDLLHLMDFLEMYHADLLICSNGINTASGFSKIFIQLFAVVAEFERDMIILSTMMEMYLGIYLSLMVSMDYPFTTKPNRRNMKTATVPSFLPNSYRS